MAATQSESDYNLRTVRERVAAALGFSDVASLTLAQRTAYNTALKAEILKYPNAFTADVFNRAAGINTTYDSRGNSTAGAVDIFLDSSADTARAINPFDTQNLPTVAKWLFFGALALGLFWVFLKTPPRGPSPARA